MSILLRCRPIMRRTRTSSALALGVGLLAGMSGAHALESDRDQQMNVDADYYKSTGGQRDDANQPSIQQLDGNVVMTQGSMKSHGDHATIYRNPIGVVDANGNKGALTRVVLTGKQAHMQQVHDGDCTLVTSTADTIDFHNATNIAILTGNVVVVQGGKGEFHGEHMTYNTRTGEMDTGDPTPGQRVHMVMEPKADAPTTVSTNNCGFPLGTHVPKTEKTAAKPAGKS